ncbi:hypothetical protein EJ02DRAFT_428256 [Clathrospora elynae]|uniref:Uncharacterized protein n=1 Tax=Clathrospora elynae TaxID=706981 RepID=A0A6A5S7X6_9PLEO|nr:hypothetical protein EJ02DRAFT_428256 [Clathrospora elynae]
MCVRRAAQLLEVVLSRDAAVFDTTLDPGDAAETEANDLEGPDDSTSEGSDSASDSGSSGSPDTDASDQEEVDEQAAAISQPSLENSALSDADTEDAGMHSESGLSATPQGAGTILENKQASKRADLERACLQI